MAAVAAAALAGRPVVAPGFVQSALLFLTGAATGAAITPAALAAAATWPLSVAWLCIATAVLCLCGYLVFRRLGGCDGPTAFYASAPGALSAVLMIAEEQGADMSRVAVAQTLRLTILAGVAPFALSAVHVAPPPPPTHGLEGLAGWALLLAASVLGWLLARRLKWPTAPFLGAMLGSGLVHLTGVVGVTIAKPALMVLSAGIGALVGVRFRGVSLSALARFLPVSAAALAIMAVVGLGSGWLAGRLTGVGPAAGMLAFAPGSMDVMIAIALALGANPAFVAAHHTARFLGLIALLPWLARRFSPPPA
jgi:membrane AbrB-like protein